MAFNFVITLCRFATNSDVPDPPDDIFQAMMGEELEHPQDPGEINLSRVQQVIITGS